MKAMSKPRTVVEVEEDAGAATLGAKIAVVSPSSSAVDKELRPELFQHDDGGNSSESSSSSSASSAHDGDFMVVTGSRVCDPEIEVTQSSSAYSSTSGGVELVADSIISVDLSSLCGSKSYGSTGEGSVPQSTPATLDGGGGSGLSDRGSVIKEETDETAQITLVGSIEVESYEDEAAGTVIDHIVCVPSSRVLQGGEQGAGEVEVLMRSASPEEPISVSQWMLRRGVSLDREQFTILETSPSMFENLTSKFLDTCSRCEQFYPKSALRTRHGGTSVERSGLEGNAVPPFGDRSVSFSSLEIREFNMTLGHHPAAVSGPPVALDWENLSAERTVNVDDYERARMPRRKRRQLKLSYRDRKGILQSDGFTDQEVNEAWAEAIKIRQQRQETLNRGLILMALDDMWESACRKYGRFTDSISETLAW